MSSVQWKNWAVALFMAASSGSAFGQQILTQKVLSLDLAQMIARAAVDKCRENSYHPTVTVVDTAGLVKITIRDDGASPQTLDVSRRKAFTAMIYRRKSLETVKNYRANPPWPGVEGTIPLGGGVPIFAGKDIVGGLGVSGAPGGEKDEACADAGIAKAAEFLK